MIHIRVELRENLISLFVVDHLVNNAGIASMCLTEDAIDITEFEPVMENFMIVVYMSTYTFNQV